MMNRRTLLGLGGLSALAVAARRVSDAAAPAGNGTAARRPTRWAIVVDVQRCRQDAGCTDCIDACHAAHNVPGIEEPRHRVRWVGKERFARVFAEQGQWSDGGVRDVPVPVMCNHCENPPCTRVCPVGATWKRDDGIVMMDYHRCIGCRYCMAACPYGSRSFNWVEPRPRLATVNREYPTRTRGVVEKCTFCEERLAKGQRPACVEACHEKALTFGDASDPGSPVRRLLQQRFALCRKPELGTGPGVYYLL